MGQMGDKNAKRGCYERQPAPKAQSLGQTRPDEKDPSSVRRRGKNEDLTHVVRQIGCHPDYLKEFLKTQSFLLRGDGPLPYDYRHYIAIMAGARHQCASLINYHKQKFLGQGGKVSWLQGLQFIPEKLRNLNEINKILAHTPWLLKKTHIQKLTKGSDNWSIGELCQAIVLLAHFHCLCSFIFATEILEQPDETSAGSQNVASEDACFDDEDAQEAVEELMERISVIQKKEKDFTADEGKSTNSLHSQDVDFKKDCDMQKYIDDYIVTNKDCDIQKFIEDHVTLHKNSTVCPENSFLIQDCTWDDHAYSLLNRYYCDVGTILDEKFKVAYDLTYYTMGHKQNVDTTVFRRAVWNYIHRIYGIIHDDYNYAEMEDLLDLGFRSYVETVCFYPEKITKNAHDEIMRAFRNSEKVHVNLMLFEARFQAELLYALSAIMRYMT